MRTWIVLLCVLIPAAASGESASGPTGARDLRVRPVEPGAAATPGRLEPEEKRKPALQPKPGADRVGPGFPTTLQPSARNPMLQKLGPTEPVLKQVDPDVLKLKAPDLAITTKAPQGASTYYNFTIKNVGTAPASSTLIEISLGPPCTFPGAMSKRKVLKRDGIPALPVTVSSSHAFKYGFPLGSWAGSGCELRGEIDPDGQMIEIDESNNQTAIGTAHQPKPDLRLALHYHGPGQGTEIEVKNVGDAAAGASTLHMSCTNSAQSVVAGNAYWQCDPGGPVGKKKWNWSIPALGPGQSHTRAFPLPAPYPANTHWWAQADHGEVVTEWDETNNGASSAN